MPRPAAVPEPRETARRAAALERLKTAGEGLSPALIAEARASLGGAFSLSDLLKRIA